MTKPKKRQSKRLSLHQQHKVKKKIADSHRKARKEAKNDPNKQKKLKKDPGIPNLYPYKEELLHQMENRKAKLEGEKERQKKLRAEEVKKKRDLQSMVSDANQRNAEFASKEKEEEERQIHAQMYDIRDGSKRAYFREFKKIVEMADVILEVLDARDPLGCRCPDIEQKILAKHPNKKIIFILNKIDLIPKENVEQWLKYLRNEYPTIAFKCSTQDQRKHLGRTAISTELASSKLLESSDCLGAETLLQLLKNYSRNTDMKTAISVGIIGYPNVGKSSLINSLKRSRAVGVGATPGFTKTIQEIQLDKQIKLLDCPGIVFGNRDAGDSDVVLRNCVKVEQVADPVTPVELIVKRCRKDVLMTLYQIHEFENAYEFLTLIAQKKGLLKRGGAINSIAAAKVILQDWNGGKIPFYTIPPTLKNVHVSAEIVTNYSKVFDLDSVIQQEKSTILDSLKSTTSHHMAFESSGMGVSDSTMMEDEQDVMMEDSDSEEEQDEDAMEDEEEEEEEASSTTSKFHQPTAIKMKQQAAAAASAAELTQQKASQQKKLRDESDELNPQLNKNQKKQQKKNKKLAKKEVSKKSDEGMDDSDEDMSYDQFVANKNKSDSYDFSTDFFSNNNKDDDSDVDLDDL